MLSRRTRGFWLKLFGWLCRKRCKASAHPPGEAEQAPLCLGCLQVPGWALAAHALALVCARQALAYAVLISRLDWAAEARAAALRARMPACAAEACPAAACCGGEAPEQAARVFGRCQAGADAGQRGCCAAAECEAGAVVQVRCCEREGAPGLVYVAPDQPACCGTDVEDPGQACTPGQLQASEEADGRPCVVVCMAPCREGGPPGKPAAPSAALRC